MEKVYAYGEAKPPARQQLWHEITGFLEAGQLLGNFTTEELQAIIDDEHLKAFGMTREERQLKQKLATEDDERDWHLISLSEDPDNLLVAVSALLHGNSLLGAPYSQVSTGPKNGRQVTLLVRNINFYLP